MNRASNSNNTLRIKLIVGMISILLLLTSCRIDEVHLPQSATSGSTIQLSIDITDDWVPENQVAEGVLALLLPQDWTIEEAIWGSTLGSGDLVFSEVWSAAAALKYPVGQFSPGMTWVAWVTDSAFAYTETEQFEATLNIQVGDSLALYKLACVATRNTHTGTGSWTKISYPHFIGVPGLEDYYSYRVEAAEDWTQNFVRRSGWTGGDGTYSIPLDGNENYSADNSRKTLFNFSDTFIGEVNDAGVRQSGTYLVNNSQAYFTGFQPEAENFSFSWGENGQSNSTWIVPATPDTEPGNWFWQMDGISLADSIHIFELRMESIPNSFAISGVVLASGIVGVDGIIGAVNQKDMALTYTNPADGSQIVFGQAILPQTIRSGCLNPDGYIYVYGPRSYSGGKALVAARVVEDSLTYIEAWHFWDGLDWSINIADCADIISAISQEHSVSETPEGEYLITFLRDGLSGPVCIALAPTPVGPFSYPEMIWTPSETEISSNVFTYNAKAHPHLSAPGELLISYEVNTWDFEEHFQNADVYHPRFIRMVYDHYLATDQQAGDTPENPVSFNLQAFPNPFNSNISLNLSEISNPLESIRIYDLNGRQVKHWNSEALSGKHTISWDGRNDLGQLLATGIYLVETRAMDNELINLTKITLLK